MKNVKRYDYQPSNSKAERTPEGFLRVKARATKVGVLKYTFDDGRTIREYRPPEEVFCPDSMATLAMKPVTNNHPSSLLDSESAHLHTVGFTGSIVTKDEETYLEVDTVITDKRTIGDAEGGKVEVSSGYVCTLDFTPGKTDGGEEYDAIQRNIRYNHLAVVKKGRCGPEVRLRLDADDAVQSELHQLKETKVMKIKLSGKEYEVADEVGAAVNSELEAKTAAEAAAKAAADAAAAQATSAAAEKETLTAKVDGLEAEVKQLKTRNDSAGTPKMAELVKARIAIEKVAEKVGVEKFDSLSDLDLKKAVIVKHDADADLAGKSNEYIDARFDVTTSAIKNSDERAGAIGGKLNNRKTEVMDSSSARQKMIERQQNAWKGKEA